MIGGEMDAPRSIPATILADIVDLAARHKAEGDRLRQLPLPLAEAFHRHDVYRLILPRDLGGLEVDPLDYLDLVEKVGRVDGATAWNLAIGAGSGLYVGYLPVERTRPMIADASCCIACAYAARRTRPSRRGGYRVSGHWGWASGVAQARWEATRSAPSPRSTRGVSRARLVACKRLRGTRSAEYEVEDLCLLT